MQNEMTTGPDLRLRRTAMHVTASALAARINVSLSWVSRRESLAVVKEAEAQRYLAGLATFGAVPTVTVEAGKVA
jgi:transcriptional regulator with XRE-family HTH domain